LPDIVSIAASRLVSTSPAPRSRRAGRALVYYPWALSERSGALGVLVAYSNVLRAAGLALDCMAPGDRAALPYRNGLALGCFDRVFGPPRGAPAIVSTLETTSLSLVDPMLSAFAGRDETLMTSAAVLSSIADYDLVAVHYTRAHSIVRQLPPHVKTVLFTHDLDAVVADQEQALFGGSNHYTVADEVARMSAFDLVTVVGPDDFRDVTRLAPNLSVVEAPFAVASPAIVPVRPQSTGVLLWLSVAASFHALSFQWFWQHCWPAIRRESAARLLVAGRICEVAASLGADADPRVRLAGVVEDCEPLFEASDLMLAPYYYGAGTKIKVLEALARGLPVATTRHGLSNSRLEPGRDVLVADEAADFAANVLQLVRSPERRRALSRAGRAYIERHHNARSAYAPLRDAIEALLERPRRASTYPVPRLGVLVEALRHLIPWTVERCLSDSRQRVVLYGAGAHTRLLVPLWEAVGGPELVAVIVSQPGFESECAGLPVIAADAFDPDMADAVVLSSHAYEGEMAQACASRWPDVPVYRVWHPGTPPADRGAARRAIRPQIRQLPTRIPGGGRAV
jgi:hypothetical protein